MRSFTDPSAVLAMVPGEVVTLLRSIDVGAGSEALYRNQLPALLAELAHQARGESIMASNAIEGIVVADSTRARKIIGGGPLRLRSRSEQELAGYRKALDYLFREDWAPLNLGLVLYLHRLLWSETAAEGGRLKTSDNLVADRSQNGSVNVRFTPVTADLTEYYLMELVDRYTTAVRTERHHPVLLIGLFVLDFLVIHPFPDGNGRVARALTNALLADAGYGVGRWVSLEQLVAESADDYYAKLLASTRGWHEDRADVWPWLTYFVQIVARAYERFTHRAASSRASGSKQDRVREYVRKHAPGMFCIADIRTSLPGISDQTIRLALSALRQEGVLVSEGTGRTASWRRVK
jgi:Fic family protein